jgi:hypothetical protein
MQRVGRLRDGTSGLWITLFRHYRELGTAQKKPKQAWSIFPAGGNATLRSNRCLAALSGLTLVVQST